MKKVLENFQNISFERTRKMTSYKPNHTFVNHLAFPFSENNDQEEMKAIAEANLADAIARLASVNGMSANDVHQLFPAILRMLKSTSEWAK